MQVLLDEGLLGDRTCFQKFNTSLRANQPQLSDRIIKLSVRRVQLKVSFSETFTRVENIPTHLQAQV